MNLSIKRRGLNEFFKMVRIVMIHLKVSAFVPESRVMEKLISLS